MRPNIDIPWSIHGRLKDLAEEREVSLSEAYEEALSRGLEELEGAADFNSKADTEDNE